MDRHGEIKNLPRIRLRPPGVEFGEVLCQWAGDLTNSKLKISAVVVVVERTPRPVVPA
jgi:hypothetical protein